MHRMAGYLLLASSALVVWLRGRAVGNDETRFAFNAVLAMMALQMVLGIMTVLYVAPLAAGDPTPIRGGVCFSC